MITPTVKHFSFRVEQARFTFVPGQFITLLIEDSDGKTQKRSYSIATQHDQSQEASQDIEFAANYVANGLSSTLLFSLQPGDTLTASGPFGRLILQDADAEKRIICLGTSTGITPYLSMIPAFRQQLANEKKQIIVIEGIRDLTEALYTDEFLKLASDFTNFRFFQCFSRETEKLAEPHQYRGRLQGVLPTLQLNPAEDILYLCGNPSMIDETFSLLKAQGFGPKSVRREKYFSRPSTS